MLLVLVAVLSVAFGQTIPAVYYVSRSVGVCVLISSDLLARVCTLSIATTRLA
jgi:hypothetical protein